MKKKGTLFHLVTADLSEMSSRRKRAGTKSGLVRQKLYRRDRVLMQLLDIEMKAMTKRVRIAYERV